MPPPMRRCEWAASDYIRRMSFEILTLKDSRSIAAAAYEREEETLRITFKPDATDRQGRTYDYLEVPADVVDEFLDAESHGQFVNWRIKPNYDCREVAQSASTRFRSKS
jgi:hypothetical protein